MSTSELKRTAKECLSGHWGPAIGVFLLFSVLQSAMNFVWGASIILGGVLATGYSAFNLAVVRCDADKTKVGTLFGGFNNFGSTCVAGLLVTTYTMLWSLLFIIPGIVKSFSYSMTFFILNDHPEMTASQAITESRRIMDGHKGELFVLGLSFIGWFILSMFTFGILLIYVIPYMQATIAAFYEKIRDPGYSDGETIDVPPLPGA